MSEEIKNQLDRIERYSLLSAKNVLCFEDVVLLTGLSKSHLYKLTSSHQIPHYKPNGKQVYFDRAEVESWMKHNRVATKEEIDQAATNYIVTGRIKKGGLYDSDRLLSDERSKSKEVSPLGLCSLNR